MSITYKISEERRQELLERYNVQTGYCPKKVSEERANDCVDLVEFVLDHLIKNGEKELKVGDQDKIDPKSVDWGSRTFMFIDPNTKQTKSYSLLKDKKIQNMVDRHCSKHNIKTPYTLRSNQKGDHYGRLSLKKPEQFISPTVNAPPDQPILQSRIYFINACKKELEKAIEAEKESNATNSFVLETLENLEKKLKTLDDYALKKALLHYPTSKSPTFEMLETAAHPLYNEVRNKLKASRNVVYDEKALQYNKDIVGVIFKKNHDYFKYCTKMSIAPCKESIVDIFFRLALENEKAISRNETLAYNTLKNSQLFDNWTSLMINSLFAHIVVPKFEQSPDAQIPSAKNRTAAPQAKPQSVFAWVKSLISG